MVTQEYEIFLLRVLKDSLHFTELQRLLELHQNNLEHVILDLTPQQLWLVVERCDDPSLLKLLTQIRFAGSAELMNDNPEEPFILWEPMNRAPEPWVAFALAKAIKLEIQTPNDTHIITIPSSGSWLKPGMKEIFPENPYIDILRKEDLEPDQPFFYEFDVPSHSRNRVPRLMALLTNPLDLKGKKVLVVDDVLARGDAVKHVSEMLTFFGVEVVQFGVVMSKIMQGGSNLLGQFGIERSTTLIPVQAVLKRDDQSIDYTFSE